MGIRNVATTRKCVAIALDQNFIAAHDDQDHASDGRLLKDGLAALGGVGEG